MIKIDDVVNSRVCQTLAPLVVELWDAVPLSEIHCVQSIWPIWKMFSLNLLQFALYDHATVKFQKISENGLIKLL